MLELMEILLRKPEKRSWLSSPFVTLPFELSPVLSVSPSPRRGAANDLKEGGLVGVGPLGLREWAGLVVWASKWLRASPSVRRWKRVVGRAESRRAR